MQTLQHHHWHRPPGHGQYPHMQRRRNFNWTTQCSWCLGDLEFHTQKQVHQPCSSTAQWCSSCPRWQVKLSYTGNTFSQMCTLVHTAQKQQSWTHHAYLASLISEVVALWFPLLPSRHCGASHIMPIFFPPPSSHTQEWQRVGSPDQICLAYRWAKGFFLSTWSVRNRAGGGRGEGGKGFRFTF